MHAFTLTKMELISFKIYFMRFINHFFPSFAYDIHVFIVCTNTCGMVTHIKIVAREKNKIKSRWSKKATKNIDSTISFQTNTNENKNKCETVCPYTTRINNKKKCDEKVNITHIWGKCGDEGDGGGYAAYSKRKWKTFNRTPIPHTKHILSR